MVDRYHPSSDQTAFAASVGKSLLAMLPLSRLHESNDESARVWGALASLGVFEIASSEQEAGGGLGAADEALIVLELGRRAVTPSVLATIGAAHLLYAVNRMQPSAGGRVAAGYRRGDQVVFVDDPAADRVLVRHPRGAALIARPRSASVLDTQLWSGRLLQAGMSAPLVEATPAQVLRLRLFDAAALAGLSRTALEMAVAYAGMREQFGRPIGSFQAVKHHCANMAVATRLASDLVSFAAVALDDGRDDAPLQVESAFYVAGSAAIDNCGKNIQIHGGMGFSDEADPHRLLKRARVLIEIGGGLEAALTRVGGCPANTELSPHGSKGRA